MADKVIFLLTPPTGGSWTVPPDWSNVNKIECLGGGGSGAGHDGEGKGGGGSGAYSMSQNVTTLTSGQVVSFGVGAGGTIGGGGDTFFNGLSINACTVGAKGGLKPSMGSTGGEGGSATYGIGDVKTPGAYGGNGMGYDFMTFGGGAGASGPGGVGGMGGSGAEQFPGSGGGGGAGAGKTTPGGAGGAGGASTGAGGTNATGGGAGGAGAAGAGTQAVASTGVWTSTHLPDCVTASVVGAAPGGGGGACGTAGGTGKNGALYGGAGAGTNTPGSQGASGQAGIIVITYTPLVSKILVKHAGVWKDPTKVWVKHAGTWKEPTGIHAKSAGVWKKVYPLITVDPTLKLNLDFTTGTLDPIVTCARSNSGTYFDVNGVLRVATANVARLDFDPLTHVPKGLLIESSRQNGMLWSEDFSNASWVKTGCTVATNQISAPDGNVAADTITASAATATLTQNSPNYAATSMWYISIFAKKGSSNWIYITAQITGTGAATPKAWFNLNTGTTGTVESGIVASGIQDIGNGWYRCWAKKLGTTGTEVVNYGICDVDAGTACTIGRTVYLWGAQSDGAATSTVDCLTSYIPTTTATYTRANETLTVTGTNFSSWYNQAVGTFVVNAEAPTSLNRAVFEVNDTTASKRHTIFGGGASLQGSTADTATVANFTIGAFVTGVYFKAAYAYAVNDFAGCVNGGTVAVDTAGTIPSGITQLVIGTSTVSTENINGHVKSIQFYNVRKTNAELQALTT